MRFTKMHGAGNDYVFINAFNETLPDDLPAFARWVSDRHAGIGSDGLIAIEPSDSADARMRIWNADGSEAEMCGNGLRCVAKYVFDHGIAPRNPLRIETGRGVLTVELAIESGTVRSARIDMGRPILDAMSIPTMLAVDPSVSAELLVGGARHHVTCVSMGNPHCVLFVDRLDDATVALGPSIERHPAFPRRTNVEFARVESPSSVSVRVWERGAGETRACGTGACAVLVAGRLTGRLGARATCSLPGGDLLVEWDGSGSVFLTGRAEEVFDGVVAPNAWRAIQPRSRAA